MIEDPQVDAYAFRSRVCLGIAAIGFPPPAPAAAPAVDPVASNLGGPAAAAPAGSAPTPVTSEAIGLPAPGATTPAVPADASL